MSDGKFQVKTIVEIWYGDLAYLFTEHLGLTEEHYDVSLHKDVGDFNILREIYPEISNGYIHTYDPSYVSSFPEDKTEIEEYIDKLIEMGVLPSGHEIYVDCSW